MSMNSREFPSKNESKPGDGALVVPLETLDRTSLPIAGGKAANLGELIHAGFAVPAGFCVTTAAYELVSAELEPLLTELATTRSDEMARLEELASVARATLLHAPVPASVAEAGTSVSHTLFHAEPLPASAPSSAPPQPPPH